MERCWRDCRTYDGDCGRRFQCKGMITAALGAISSTAPLVDAATQRQVLMPVCLYIVSKFICHWSRVDGTVSAERGAFTRGPALV